MFSTHLFNSACSTRIWPVDIFLVLSYCYLNTWNELKIIDNQVKMLQQWMDLISVPTKVDTFRPNNVSEYT